MEFGILRRAKESDVLGMIIIIGMEFILLGTVSWKFSADQRTMSFPIKLFFGLEVAGVFFSKSFAFLLRTPPHPQDDR